MGVGMVVMNWFREGSNKLMVKLLVFFSANRIKFYFYCFAIRSLSNVKVEVALSNSILSDSLRFSLPQGISEIVHRDAMYLYSSRSEAAMARVFHAVEASECGITA
jgi:hypothetical protein